MSASMAPSVRAIARRFDLNVRASQNRPRQIDAPKMIAMDLRVPALGEPAIAPSRGVAASGSAEIEPYSTAIFAILARRRGHEPISLFFGFFGVPKPTNSRLSRSIP